MCILPDFEEPEGTINTTSSNFDITSRTVANDNNTEVSADGKVYND